jgi:hypothetical protein
MLQVSFFCQIGEGIIFVTGERSPTIIFFWERILDQLFEYQQIRREAYPVGNCQTKKEAVLRILGAANKLKAWRTYSGLRRARA